MYFFAFNLCVFLFVQESDGGKGVIGFHNEDIFQVRGITKADALSGKAEIHLVFHLVNHDNAVSGDPAFDFQKEVLVRNFVYFTNW